MSMNIWDDAQRRLLGRFPKVRNELPEEYRAFHEEFYKAAREGKHAGATIALQLEKWMHRKLTAYPAGFPFLEIGAGTLNHVPYEPSNGKYDIIEPMPVLFEDKAEVSRISGIYKDIRELEPVPTYDRIGSVAVLEHVLDLPDLIARSALLLTGTGVFRAGIPSEGGFLWRMAYKYGTGTTFRLKFKLDYEVFQKYEHVNTAREIIDVTKLFFEDVVVSNWPLPAISMSFYTFIEARRPRTDLASKFLEDAKY